MAKHLSVRLPWHDRGWDGHVCDRPTANVFCAGEYGLKAHGIREGKKDIEEEARRSRPCASLRADGYRPRKAAVETKQLDKMAELIRSLTYGEMLDLAAGLLKAAADAEITGETLPAILHRWASEHGN